MTKQQERKTLARYSIIEVVIGYLLIQAFLLVLLVNLPWPIVDVYSFVHVRTSATPTPVWVLYWGQLAIGLFLPLRGKAFVIGQFVIFASVFLLLAKVKQTPGQGDVAVVPSVMYPVYWFQFFATALGLISWRYLGSKAFRWYPLIAFFAMQLVSVWGISQFRVSVGADLRTWILLAFLGQFIGLLFTPIRVKLFVSAEVLLGVSIAQLPSLLPTGWNSPPDTVGDGLWVTYLIQCAWFAWWFLVSIPCRRASHPTATDAPYKTSNDEEAE